MKVINQYDYRSPPRPMAISDAVSRILDGVEYGQGALEDVQRSIENTRRFVAVFVEMLYDKNILSKEEILALLGSSYKEHIE